MTYIRIDDLALSYVSELRSQNQPTNLSLSDEFVTHSSVCLMNSFSILPFVR